MYSLSLSLLMSISLFKFTRYQTFLYFITPSNRSLGIKEGVVNVYKTQCSSLFLFGATVCCVPLSVYLYSTPNFTLYVVVSIRSVKVMDVDVVVVSFTKTFSLYSCIWYFTQVWLFKRDAGDQFRVAWFCFISVAEVFWIFGYSGHFISIAFDLFDSAEPTTEVIVYEWLELYCRSVRVIVLVV